MKKTDFFDLVEQPGLLNEATLPLLNEIVGEFPWFQSARMLLVKNLHLLDDMRFNGELKHSAAYIANRKRLYELINQQYHKQKSVNEEINIIAEKNDKVTDQVAKTNGINTNVGVTANVSSVTDYFQTDDVFETSEGSKIDFSVLSEGSNKDDDNASLILPSADFLEYESSDYVGYELKDSVNPDDELEENRSFSDWLTILRHVPAKKEIEEGEGKKKTQQIIDNFLNIESPRIVPSAIGDIDEQSIKTVHDDDSLSENDDLMTETLAGIYIKQKYYDKAINIYKKLSLKYPEKNVYFAQRIRDLEKLNN